MLVFSLLALVLTGLVGMLLMYRLQTHSMQSVSLQLESWRLLLAIVRWALLGMMSLCWPVLIKILIRIRLIDESRHIAAANLRWRVVGWLLLLELLVGQGLLAKLIGLLTGVGW